MLTAVPRHWLSWGFALTDGEKALAEIDISMWREKGAVTISGASYHVYREALMSGAFVLESNGTVIARAQKPSAFSRRMVIMYNELQYELKPYSTFSRRFHLISGTTPVGTLSPGGWFSRRMNIDLPEKLPLPVRTFIVWLTLVMWKRDWDAGGA